MVKWRREIERGGEEEEEEVEKTYRTIHFSVATVRLWARLKSQPGSAHKRFNRKMEKSRTESKSKNIGCIWCTSIEYRRGAQHIRPAHDEWLNENVFWMRSRGANDEPLRKLDKSQRPRICVRLRAFLVHDTFHRNAWTDCAHLVRLKVVNVVVARLPKQTYSYMYLRNVVDVVYVQKKVLYIHITRFNSR